MRRTQSTLKSNSPDFTPWLSFFLRALQKQKIHLETKITKEKALLSLPELSSKVLLLIKDHGRLGISDLQKMTGANRNTLKKQLERMTSQGNIVRHGKGRATWYTTL